MSTVWNATEIANIKQRVSNLERGGNTTPTGSSVKILNNTASDISAFGGMEKLLQHPFLICVGGLPGELGSYRGFRLESHYVDLSESYTKCGQICFLQGGTGIDETMFSVSFREFNDNPASNFLPHFKMITDWSNSLDGYDMLYSIHKIVVFL